MNFLEKMKWSAIRDNFVVPAAGRIGTWIAAGLVPFAASADDAHKVGVGVAIGLCIAYDLIVDWVGRKMAERKGAAKALTNPRRSL